MPGCGRFLVGAAVQHFLGHGYGQLGLDAGGNEGGVGHVGEGGNFLAGFQLGDQLGHALSLQGVALDVAVDLALEGEGQALLGGVEGVKFFL